MSTTTTPSPTTTVLDTIGLAVGYAGVAVTTGIDLAVHPGEITVILGPNGAGKTTTILTLAGELPPVAGQVLLSGDPAPGPLHRRARRGLALVTEERAVFAGLTVDQNLAIGRCVPERALELFPELRPLRRRRAGLLSGGEQQMLALGRALARPDTAVLLADELSLGLAPKVTERLLGAVRDSADDGLAVVLVEQHVHRVLRIADRVLVLAAGRVAYDAPANQARTEIDVIEAQYLGGGVAAGTPTSNTTTTRTTR